MNTIKIVFKINQLCDLFATKVFKPNDVYYNSLVIKIILHIILYNRVKTLCRLKYT